MSQLSYRVGESESDNRHNKMPLEGHRVTITDDCRRRRQGGCKAAALSYLLLLSGFLAATILIQSLYSSNDESGTGSPFLSSLPMPRRQLLSSESQHQAQNNIPTTTPATLAKIRPLKILYTVTTLAEYDTGSRATTKGSDRLQGTTIPVLREGVESLINYGHSVDVMIVAHFTFLPERLQLVKDALPASVTVRVWDDATPLAYGVDEKPDRKLVRYTQALARQHRFVVKEYLFDYDMFLNFEDDMAVKANHVNAYVQVTQELYKLREQAPDTVDKYNNPYGLLTKDQLKRIMPGFIRVEALLDEATYGTQKELHPVPVTDRPQVDPSACCHMSDFAVRDNRPAQPKSDDLFLWEITIKAAGVRQMPAPNGLLDYVLMQRGPRVANNTLAVADFWSGTPGYLNGERRPAPGDFSNINNQGGWMATRQQLWEWHTEICPGGFLPPYEAPHYRFDGLDARNVEWWSGGMSLATVRHACNLQRIIPLQPEMFANFLLCKYHFITCLCIKICFVAALMLTCNPTKTKHICVVDADHSANNSKCHGNMNLSTLNCRLLIL